MVHQTPATTSWNGGELSPLMVGRVDTSIYQIAAERMENFVPCIEGPLQKCPGFERIRAAADTASWMLRFVFNLTQSYALECSDRRIRFYTNGGRIEAGASSPYEVAVPYRADEWPRVSTHPRFDRVYIAHGNHAPAALTRTAATVFDYAPLDLINGPFGDSNNDQARALTVGGDLSVGGSVTINSAAPIFADGHAGALFQVEALDFSDVQAWSVGLNGITPGTLRRSDGKVYQAVEGARTGTITPTHEEGAEWDGDKTGKDINDKGPYGVKWAYLHDRFGIIRLTEIVSPTQAKGIVIRRVPGSLATVASWRWAHGAFSAAEGWPDLVFIRDERLCFYKGFDRYSSVVGDYRNFQAYTSSGYTATDLAFRYRIDAENPPLWVRADRDGEVIGTASGEYAIVPINPQAGVAGGNIKSVKQSRYGCAAVWPEEPGTTVVYVQRGAKQLREAAFDFGSDRYQSANINRWARHIAKPGLIQLGHQAIPEELLFAVRRDGVLVFRSYDPEQEVKGFARRVLGQGGRVLSAIAIPSEDGALDEIWALCQWGNVKSVQRMADWWEVGTDVADSFFVDDGFTVLLDQPSTTIPVPSWLAGTEVSILADGGVCPRQTVAAGGQLTIGYPARRWTVGRGYRAECKTLRPEVRDPTGQTAQGKRKRLVNVIVRLLETSGLKINAGTRDQIVLDRPTSARMDAPEPLFTGDTEGVSVGGDWGTEAPYTIVSDDPRPAFIIMAMPRLEVSDR